MRGLAWLTALTLWSVQQPAAHAEFHGDMMQCRDLVSTNPAGAIRACQAAIGMAERNPELLSDRNRADLWFQIALAYEAKSDNGNAIAALTTAIQVFDGDYRFFMRRARLNAAQSQFQSAIRDHDRAIALIQNPRPGYATDKNMLFQSYLDRGACWEKLGQSQKAIDNYDLALAVYPGAEQALAAKSRLAAQPPVQTARTNVPAIQAPQSPASPRPPAGPALPKRAALIIGNGQYLYTNSLPNAVNDAKDVAQALREKGYAIYGYPQINMHREDMFAALDAFAKAAADADIALVWYAGHGQQMSDPGEAARNWLFPVDFKSGMDLDRGAIPLTKLLGAAQSAKKLRVVVVDACRNTTLQANARAARGFRPEPRAGMVVVYSTSAGNIAEDGDPSLRNSPFAAAFLETLKAHGNVDVRQFFGGVSEGVRQRTHASEMPQQPELMSNLNTIETLALAP